MLNVLVANFAGAVRRETVAGRDYLVADLTMIVPGVLAGSKGRLYYPPDEVARNVEAWNGVPMVVNHPTRPDGRPASAGDPGVWEASGIGTVHNAAFRNNKLVAEGWFDIERTRRVDARVLTRLLRGERIEISTGLFTRDEPAPRGATHNGKSYDYIARNYRPDHLAILPDSTGACSMNDGCGINVTTNSEDNILPCPGDPGYLVFNEADEGCGCGGKDKPKKSKQVTANAEFGDDLPLPGDKDYLR